MGVLAIFCSNLGQTDLNKGQIISSKIKWSLQEPRDSQFGMVGSGSAEVNEFGLLKRILYKEPNDRFVIPFYIPFSSHVDN